MMAINRHSALDRHTSSLVAFSTGRAHDVVAPRCGAAAWHQRLQHSPVVNPLIPSGSGAQRDGVVEAVGPQLTDVVLVHTPEARQPTPSSGKSIAADTVVDRTELDRGGLPCRQPGRVQQPRRPRPARACVDP